MTSEKTIIDDLVVLGRAVPEPIKNGRVTVCLGGYSRRLGFTRIYPTRPTTPIHRWDVISVPAERDPRDSRTESWKIQGSKNEWHDLDSKVKVVDTLDRSSRLNLIGNLTDDCVNKINEEQRSLGIVKPTIKKSYFCEEKNFDPLLQITLFGTPLAATKKQYHQYPKVKYRCQKCEAKNGHDQTVLDWGFYEWMRKNPDNIEQVWKNAFFDSDKRQIFFFVGNMRDRRTAFLIISTLPLPNESFVKPLVPLRRWLGDGK
jgi:hypothetical protein